MSLKVDSGNSKDYEEFEIFETDSFRKSFEKYHHLKPAVENKFRVLRVNPYVGEPLKHQLLGFRSIPVKRNFLILYGICRECKKCRKFSDKTVVLYAFGPHDDLYKIARMISKGKRI